MTLKQWLKYKGWSVVEFSNRIHVTPMAANNWINHNKKPNRNNALKIEFISNGRVKASDLLKLEKWSHAKT